MNKAAILLFCVFFATSGSALAGKNKSGQSLCDEIDRQTLIEKALEIVPGDTYLIEAGNGAPTIPDDTTPNGGFDLPMWVAIVDINGAVCQVINTGREGNTIVPDGLVSNQSWLGSRNIAVQKANAANAFSTDYYAISTANLFGAVQGNESLFGLQHSNPVDPNNAYSGNPIHYGSQNDPMVGMKIGGVNVFGGGLALYHGGEKIGAIGVSGDTSCTDHVVAWKIRDSLGFDAVPRGPIKAGQNFAADGTPLNLGGALGDEMYMDEGLIGIRGAIAAIANALGLPNPASGWEHPSCPNTPGPAKNGGAIVGNLP
ncbi:MAG: GlcG/HbpS family heme-binding protein [Gammaproteobacteria bacterium]